MFFPLLPFAAVINGAGTFFEQEGGTKNIKYKLRFAKKWPLICIN